MPQSLDEGICDDRSRVVADHAVTVSGARPFGKEATLAVGIHHPLSHLCSLFGVDKMDQRHKSSEGIPVARVGIEVAREYLPIVWAVVDGLPLGIDLIEASGEEE